MFFHCIGMGKLPLVFAFILRILVSIILESIIGSKVWLGLGISPIVVEGLFGLVVAIGVLIVKERFQGLGDHFNCVF